MTARLDDMPPDQTEFNKIGDYAQAEVNGSISSGRDGKVLVHCHAGCDQRGVIAILRQRGLWETTRKSWGCFGRKRKDIVSDEPEADALKRSEALAIWQASQPAEQTPVTAYLRSRGLVLPASGDLRFHPGLKHPSGGCWRPRRTVHAGGGGSPCRATPGPDWRVLDAHRERFTRWQRPRPAVRIWKRRRK